MVTSEEIVFVPRKSLGERVRFFHQKEWSDVSNALGLNKKKVSEQDEGECSANLWCCDHDDWIVVCLVEG